MSIPDDVRAMICPPRAETRIALVGASTHRHKYGNIILRDLVAKGFTVYPVNPAHAEVEGIVCHPTVDSIGVEIDIVNFVVPATVGLPILEHVDDTKVPVVWFQPGAGSPEIREAVERFRHGLVGPCIMVESR